MSGWQDKDLRDLAWHAESRRVAEQRVREQVAFLRQRECPWSVIAEQLGVSKQAAAKRYGSERVSLTDRALPLEDGPEPSQRRPQTA